MQPSRHPPLRGAAFAAPTALPPRPYAATRFLTPRQAPAPLQTAARRRPRATPPSACGVFIWSHDFDDEAADPSEDEEADASELPADAPDAETYDDTVLGDAWRRPPADPGISAGGAGFAAHPPHAAASGEAAAANRLYFMLRERTAGPDDVDRLRALATESAADAFRRIVMGILGTIPGDTYEVVISSDRGGVARLMQSSLSTGYALRNAEFRMLLNESMAAPARGERARGFGERAEEPGAVRDLFTGEPDYMRNVPRRGKVDASGLTGNVRWWDLEREAKQEMTGMDYVARLEAENELLRERLAATQLHDSNNNKLMDFMRTLNPEKIAALQANLSLDAADAFKRIIKSVLGELSPSKVQQTYSTSRDYLAQLTFWCLLVGYCIRNIEKRMEMTKVFEETETFAESSLRDFEF